MGFKNIWNSIDFITERARSAVITECALILTIWQCHKTCLHLESSIRLLSAGYIDQYSWCASGTGLKIHGPGVFSGLKSWYTGNTGYGSKKCNGITKSVESFSRNSVVRWGWKVPVATNTMCWLPLELFSTIGPVRFPESFAHFGKMPAQRYTFYLDMVEFSVTPDHIWFS